jgi:c-di-GMP-related signal transduction protein
MSSIAVDEPHGKGAAPARTDGARIDVCFARQPILDREGMLCGFELKVHCVAKAVEPAASTAHEAHDTHEAPTRTGAIADALARPNLRHAMAGHPGYLAVDREMLFDEAILRIAHERFVFEISPQIDVDAALIARLVVLHARRYRFVIDGVSVPNEAFAKLLPYAEGVKIAMTAISRALLPKFANVLKSAGKLLIAGDTETQDDFDAAHELGFDRFQGYYFARAQSARARKVSAPRHALLNLLQLLAGEPTVAQLEAELKLNPVLVMHLMKLANSSGLALGHKVTSLREAINATGTNRIARWTQLLLYADGRKVALEDDPLLQLAATRARFMELAVMKLPEADREEADSAFLTGVFSFVDAVFGGSLAATLNVLALAKPIQAAILHREGVLGQLLAAIEALEHGAWADVEAVCQRLAPLSASEAAQLALSAAAWAGMADRSAEASGLQRIED